LAEIRSLSPAKLIGLYRYLHNIAELAPLPHHLTLETMIEGILDREADSRPAAGVIGAACHTQH
jgi:hypothetical protein